MVNHTAQSSNISVRAELSAAVAGLVRAGSKLPAATTEFPNITESIGPDFRKFLPDIQRFEFDFAPIVAAGPGQSGYYRARTCKSSAQAVTQGGIVPETHRLRANVLRLPEAELQSFRMVRRLA